MFHTTQNTKEIIAEFIVLMQLVQDGSDWQIAESYSDDGEIHLMVERLYTPSWMDDQFIFTCENCVTGETRVGSVKDVIRWTQPAKLYKTALAMVGA